MFDQNQIVFFIAVGIIVLAAAAYIYISTSKPPVVVERYPNLKLEVKPATTSMVPSKICYLGVEQRQANDGGSWVSLGAAFRIKNIGNESLKYPATIYMVFEGEIVAEDTFYYPYAPGEEVFGGKKEFSFTKEFANAEFRRDLIYTTNVAFNFKLVYCDPGCANPLTDGKVIYQNTTAFCCKMPSSSFPGTCRTM